MVDCATSPTTSRYMSDLCEWGKLEVPTPYRTSLETRDSALRVVLFGSAVRGQVVLHHLIEQSGQNPGRVALTGVCTDDVSGGKISKGRRLWQYISDGDAAFLQAHVEQTARWAGVPLFTGSVKSTYFQEVLLKHWRPDVIIMATFGQLVPPEVFERPRFGMYNLHPSDLSREKHPGPDPFGGIMRAGESFTRMTLHHVDHGFDTGPVVGVSPEICIRRADGTYPSNLRMHEQTAGAAATMACRLVDHIADTKARVGKMDFEEAFDPDETARRQLPLEDRQRYGVNWDKLDLATRWRLHVNGGVVDTG